MIDLDRLDQVEAVLVREPHVDEDEIRLLLGDRAQGGLQVLGLAAAEHVLLPVDQLSDALTEDRMVVHDQDACLRHVGMGDRSRHDALASGLSETSVVGGATGQTTRISAPRPGSESM